MRVYVCATGKQGVKSMLHHSSLFHVLCTHACSPKIVMTHVYVKNVAHAHAAAAAELLHATPRCAGSAYLLSEAPAGNFWLDAWGSAVCLYVCVNVCM